MEFLRKSDMPIILTEFLEKKLTNIEKRHVTMVT